MQIYTIGFAGKSAEKFFSILTHTGVAKVIDIRRSHNTLYSGFTRSRDLPFFLRQIGGIPYVHEPDFAPSLELLRDYQKRLKVAKRDPDAWPEYVRRFAEEIVARPIMERFREHATGAQNVCFLCTEPSADRCHRRLLAEFVRDRANGDIDVVHL